MSGSQSVSPQAVIPSRPRKRFTLAEANKSLPLVSRIVKDIVKSRAALVEAQQAYAESMARDRSALQDNRDKSMDAMMGYVDELEALGIELKDPDIGLIDFVGHHQDRDVCLCWKLGEERVDHWHELDAGFAGRKPVSELDEDE